MKIKKKPTLLMILDGFGINKESYGNAILQADTPFLDKLFATYSWVKLNPTGEAVGLPDGQMGNSEVGHLNIGSGRIIYQDLSKITKEIKDGDFFKNENLLQAISHAKQSKGALHILGLLSDGGVHSHIYHMKAVLDMAVRNGLDKVYFHVFTDGRDVPPKSALDFISDLEDYITLSGVGKIATISGRYYAMDRDNRWERIQLAYDAMTSGIGYSADDSYQAVEAAYERGETDEFIKPTVVAHEGTVLDGDGIIFVNFRPDRAREITKAFVSCDDNLNSSLKRKTMLNDIVFTCMTEYDKEIKNVLVAYPPKMIKNTLGEYISSLGLNQLRIAETEKYAHVTFFLNGGVEKPMKNEDRILVPSPKVATYDLQPEMSAYLVTEKLLEALDSQKYDLIILNFANSDMVGHTGDFEASKKAISALDKCISQIVPKVMSLDGQIIMTADHGNSDVMLTEDGEPMTAHSMNMVPFMHISHSPCKFNDYAKSNQGKLSDIAPTVLKLMGLSVPDEMTGNSLI